MTELVLLAKTLTTDYGPVYQEIFEHFSTRVNLTTPNVDRSYDLFLTNVLYTDDAAMQNLLATKIAAFPPAPRIFTSMHELARPILNASASLMIVDCLNFYVSNIMLLYNSDPQSEKVMREYIRRDILKIILALHDGTLDIAKLVVLTSDVDFDFYIHTEAGKMYRRLIHYANGLFSQAADRYGLITNGAVLWSQPYKHAL
ncbi:Adenosylcobinamide-phosphate guanylyltransferase (modular protein) [Gammaproteobacteria bacterium]